MWFPSHRPVIFGQIQILLLLAPWLLGLTYDPSALNLEDLAVAEAFTFLSAPSWQGWTRVDAVKKASITQCSSCSSPFIFIMYSASGGATHFPVGVGGSLLWFQWWNVGKPISELREAREPEQQPSSSQHGLSSLGCGSGWKAIFSDFS